ncbi:GNAT family N-acetyltransferase [Streptomyces sp. RPT161]|uniref:GNAT family N-acetyltransferase n=1 Tax=Streptomyces sp. RPT161 TaxID=3015993 RepID=UPI0022B8C584|nr:GNAT family N-acetyltransferase [Streptomyces sp. RPT161]
MFALSHGRATRAVAASEWFGAEQPGPSALAWHVLATGNGGWWADRPYDARALAVRCADHCLLRGDPRVCTPTGLAPLAGAYIDAPQRFLPLLGAAFRRLTPWERMVYLREEPAPRVAAPAGVTVRRLTAADGFLLAVEPDLAWLAEPWRGPRQLAGRGLLWGAIAEGRLVSVAGTYFLGSRHADVGVATAPAHRRRGLALACVAGLCSDIDSAGLAASWTVARDNPASRSLAWRAGFRLRRELVHYFVDSAVGAPAGDGRPRTAA